MTFDRLSPDTPLLENYLAAASANHPGNRQLDLAVWYAILQNYANRHCMIFGRRAFRVHFLLIAPSSFGKSSSLNFGFHKFLIDYQRSVSIEDDHFLYLGGQNTAAGLTDALNDASDEWERQVATAWVHETSQLLGGAGRYHHDIISFFHNILNGIPNVRRVREKIFKGSDRVKNPVVNAVFPATPEQYGPLMKGSSSTLLKQFLLVAPAERDRDLPQLDVENDLDVEAQLSFEQWLNGMEMCKATPKSPRNIGISNDARKFLESNLQLKAKSHEEERNFYNAHREQIAMLAALNALSRVDFEVSEEDVACAWNFVSNSYVQQQRLESIDEDDGAGMTPAQRTRSANIAKVLKVVKRSGRDGIGRDEISRSIYALKNAMNKTERDDLFTHIEEEFSDELFKLNVDITRKDGKAMRKLLYFHTSVWTITEAVQELTVAVPYWNSTAGAWTDAIGNTHNQLTDCIGYKPEWERICVKGPNALN